MEVLTAGELNIREAFLQESIQHLQEKLSVIDKLREVPQNFDSFELRVFEKADDKVITRFYGHEKVALVNEIFHPLIEQGLAEYRKRLQMQIDS